ncbi:unnamed protein product [Knipowitschia caucasica]|uniref:Uncharacterized protein n=1 Tax=Knipowitschia caucasica TaxID=637954 RepID=A0AAV2KPY3_KNICA
MSSLQVSVVLLCLLGLSCAAFDPERLDQIIRNINKLKQEKLDLTKRYALSNEFSAKVLDQGLKMVGRMDELVHENGLEVEFPSVAEFVEDLRTFIENTKDFTQKQMETMAKEYGEKKEMIHALALEALD